MTEMRNITAWSYGYKASADGNIYNRRGEKLTPRAVGLSGYEKVTLYTTDHRGKQFYIHQLVYEAFKGKVPDGCEIDHVNGIKNDNRIDNLEAVTHKENVARYWQAQMRYKLDNESKEELMGFSINSLGEYGFRKRKMASLAAGEFCRDTEKGIKYTKTSNGMLIISHRYPTYRDKIFNTIEEYRPNPILKGIYGCAYIFGLIDNKITDLTTSEIDYILDKLSNRPDGAKIRL